MKVIVDGQQLFELTAIQKKVIAHDIRRNELDDDVKRRLQWVAMEKYEACFKRLKDEWDPKLAERGVAMIPTNQDAYAQLVFSQPDYKDRQDRDADPDLTPPRLLRPLIR